MSRRTRIFWLSVLAVLLVLTITGLDLCLSPRNDVAAYKAELRAKGEKLEISELVSPPVPPGDNSADTVRTAFSMLSNHDFLQYSNPLPVMKMVAPGRAMVAWAQPDIRGTPDKHGVSQTNTWDEVAAALSSNDVALAELRDVIARPKIDFGLDYHQGFRLPLPHLSKIKNAGQRLLVAIIYDLHNQDTPAALTNLLAQLALVQGMQDERTLISQLVRFAIANYGFLGTWELLQATNLNEGELALLQQSWENQELIDPLVNTIAMERAMAQVDMQRLRAAGGNVDVLMGGSSPSPTGSSGDWMEDLDDFWSNAKKKGKEFAWVVAWSHPDELKMLKGHQVYLDTLRSVETNGCYLSAFVEQTNRLKQVGIGDDAAASGWFTLDDVDLGSMFSDEVVAQGSAVRRLMKLEASRQVAIAAIALKRYELKNGGYPASLTNLVPAFVKSVPFDPADGRPLRYRLNPDGSFLLYSIGLDGRDDGGDPTPVSSARMLFWTTCQDWVWPMPATPSEINAYYTNTVYWDKN